MKRAKEEKPKAEGPQKADEKRAKLKKGELEQLRQQLNDVQNEKDELFEKLQRVSADYANFQKRVPKQIADTICYEKEKIIKTLLPALDNFEHTLQSFNLVQDKKTQSAENADVLIKGVRIIYEQLLDILKSHGVEQIKAQGENFDPALHQAMMQKADSDREENIVLEEFQKGYKLNGRVIRPSKVVVNKQSSEQEIRGPEEQGIRGPEESGNQGTRGIRESDNPAI